MRICIFCGANSGIDPEIENQVNTLMNHFAEHDIELVYGGAGIGIMGKLATGLINRGGKVTGIIPQQLMKVEIAHGGLDKLHVVKDMHERKKMMYDLSDAFLILPGGMGTLDEMFEILTWKQIGIHRKPIAVLNINGYFSHLLQFLDHAMEQKLLKPEHRNYLFTSPRWEDIWEYFQKNG